jgi:transcription initiation factor IIE alpha subunit
VSLNSYIQTLKRLDDLIYRRATGTPSELSEKLQLSSRHVNRILNTMKENGAKIRYNKLRESYEYEEENRRFIIGWHKIRTYAELNEN